MAKSSIQDFVELPGGGKLYLLPVSEADVQGVIIAVRKEFVTAGKPINPPTYTTEAGETFPWDAAGVERDGSDEDKAAWKAHAAALEEFTTEQERRVMYYILTESPFKYVTAKGNSIDLAIDELEGQWAPPAAWLEKQQRLGYVLPDNAYDRKVDFLNSVVKGVEAKRAIITTAMALSLRGVVSDEAVERYEATFRRQMAEAGRAAEAKLITAIEGTNRVAEGGAGTDGQG